VTEIKTLNSKDVTDYKAIFGADRFAMTMKTLGKSYVYLHAVIEASPGKEILEEDLVRHEDLLLKMYDEKISDDERAELRYLKRRIAVIGNRLFEYQRKEAKVKEQIAKGERNGR